MGGRNFTGKQVGRYLLTSILGSGAAGNVYRGVDITLKNSPTYAIKCVRESNHPARRKQQFAEIKNHDAVVFCPQVLMLCDAFEEDHYLFLVSPLCEMDMYTAIFGKQLYWRNDALIKKSFVEILDGIFACHRRGVFHRDLKPENIMCNSDGTRIKIGDFGLSTNRRLCRDGACGTAPYMSPECLDRKEFCYDANQGDIWSLGVILFNMVTRRYPWEEARVADRVYTKFLLEREYLLRTSPISKSLNVLLRQILHPVPMKRLSIPAIRQAVMEMDTFYKLPRARIPHVFPLLSTDEVAMADSDQTCVAPVGDEEKKGCAPIDSALESAFHGLEIYPLSTNPALDVL